MLETITLKGPNAVSVTLTILKGWTGEPVAALSVVQNGQTVPRSTEGVSVGGMPWERGVSLGSAEEAGRAIEEATGHLVAHQFEVEQPQMTGWVDPVGVPEVGPVENSPDGPEKSALNGHDTLPPHGSARLRTKPSQGLGL